ncbi:MAG: ammonia-forming cytochrome c nitrite reductase [Wolinella sp.]
MTKYKLLLAGSLVAIVSMGLLASNISDREKERVALNKTAHSEGIQGKAMNEEWAKYYPRQFDTWKQTRESKDIEDMLAKKPALVIAWSGYAFAKNYNAPRGHYYAIQDVTNILRTGAPVATPEDPLGKTSGPLPTACWTCKSPDVARLMEEDGELEYFTGKWAKYGAEIVNPIGCYTCHDDKTAELKVKYEFLDRALVSAGFRPSAEATHQEKRSLVCAQCHVEYYFKKTEWTDDKGNKKVAQVVTLPWANGIKFEDMEKYYDDMNFTDWTHNLSGTPMLKAQHPDWEFHQTGIHGQKGVSCADCHMPYTQEGAIKYTDHKVGNPLDNMDKSCMNCHRESEEKLRNIVKQKYERKDYLQDIAFDNIAKAHLETAEAIRLGASDAELKEIRTHIRHAQFRADLAIAGHGSFFHAPEEVLRALASGNEEAQQARLKLVKVLAKYGAMNYIAPDFDSRDKAQKLAKLDMDKLIAEKVAFRNTLVKEWRKQAIAKGRLNPKFLDTLEESSSYEDRIKK